MFCPNCGEKLPEGSAFCGKCGTKLPKMQPPVGEGTAKEMSAGSDGFDADAGGPRGGAAVDFSEPAGSAGGGPDDGGRKGGVGKKAAVLAGIVATVAAAAAVSAFLIISGDISGSVSGGAEDDDGVITVTFDCGTEETSAEETVISSDGSGDDTETEPSGSESSVISL